MDNKKDKTDRLKETEVTRDSVRKWVKKDLVAAHYFLGTLVKYPEIMESCADQLFDALQKGEQEDLDKKEVVPENQTVMDFQK